jgi:Integrase zinc binding domain
MKVNVLGFEVIKELYVDDEFFGKIKDECAKGPYKKFMVNDGYLFYGNRLCISNYSLRWQIIKEDHDGGLSGHFGQDKTGALLQDRFYWLKMMKNGENEPNSWASSFQPGENDGDQVMRDLQVNNHDQGSIFWTSSQFEEPGPSHIYN